MSEDLKNEILTLLRELREGTPGTFQMLVDQRALYCGVRGLGFLMVAAVLLVNSVVAYRRMKFAIDDEFPQTLFAVLSCASLLGALVAADAAVALFAEAIAPLGTFVEVLK